MSYRHFIDEGGNHWQVWDVVPDEADRRLRERRILHDPPAEERRDLTDRRGRPRHDLPPELADGWLVFQSMQGKRRFWPIPAGWYTMSDTELRELWSTARIVTRADPDLDAPSQQSPQP